MTVVKKMNLKISQNNKPWKLPVLKNYKVRSEKAGHAFRCVHLSDLHCCIYGKHQRSLIRMIDAVSPDLICMTGDMLGKRFHKEAAGDLFKALGKKYPCYYVTGNHEFIYKNPDKAKVYVRSFGIHVLEGEGQILDLDGMKVCICGVDDPMNPQESWMDQLNRAQEMSDRHPELFSVLLTHRPERIQSYIDSGFDLVLSGHAHGGQWRIPGLINGIYAPSQGFFPKYAGGRYDFGHQVHINSRGLAYYVSVPRIFNPVELGVIDIIPGKES